MPWISLSLKASLRPRRPCRTTASSSAVRSGTVAIRQWSTTRSPSNTPSTVLVFPMSMVSSTAEIPFRVLTAGQHDRHIVDQPGAGHGDRGHDQRGPGPGRAERARIDHRDVVDRQRGLAAQDLLGGGQDGGGAMGISGGSFGAGFGDFGGGSFGSFGGGSFGGSGGSPGLAGVQRAGQ